MRKRKMRRKKRCEGEIWDCEKKKMYEVRISKRTKPRVLMQTQETKGGNQRAKDVT